MDKIRVGAVSYLNTKPLVYGLSRLDDRIELSFDLPSRLADKLAASELDIAIIPSIEAMQRSHQYEIISDACIACAGPVWSVRVLSKVPFDQIESLALDEGSRTSVALTTILFSQQFGKVPATRNLPMSEDPYQQDTDAVLVIGDRAMKYPPDTFPHIWDLGEKWFDHTGFPFVFAMWTARKELDVDGIEEAFVAARDRGLNAVEEIARNESPRYGLTHQQCVDYLTKNLHFYLGENERRGLQLFQQFAIETELAPKNTELTFHDCQTS